MMSLLKKKPRYEVISIRLNEDRLKLLERHQKVLGDQLGREVSLGEAAFLVIEERGAGLDPRGAARMLSTPTSSLTHSQVGIAAHTICCRVGRDHFFKSRQRRKGKSHGPGLPFHQESYSRCSTPRSCLNQRIPHRSTRYYSEIRGSLLIPKLLLIRTARRYTKQC